MAWDFVMDDRLLHQNYVECFPVPSVGMRCYMFQEKQKIPCSFLSKSKALSLFASLVNHNQTRHKFSGVLKEKDHLLSSNML